MTDKEAIAPTDCVTLEAMIQYNTSGFHRHKLRDIGLEGAFIEMGNARVLRRDAPVRVVFVYQEQGASTTHRIEASVSEIRRNGARLTFSNLDQPAMAALQKLEFKRRLSGANGETGPVRQNGRRQISY